MATADNPGQPTTLTPEEIEAARAQLSRESDLAAEAVRRAGVTRHPRIAAGQPTTDNKPWALVCRKGNRFGGAISLTLPPTEVAKFLASFIADGYSIVTVYNREEYENLWDTLDQE